MSLNHVFQILILSELGGRSWGGRSGSTFSEFTQLPTAQFSISLNYLFLSLFGSTPGPLIKQWASIFQLPAFLPAFSSPQIPRSVSDNVYETTTRCAPTKNYMQ